MLFFLNTTVSAFANPINSPNTLRFGAIADCQYADKDNSTIRYYRSCPDRLAKAVQYFNTQPLDFVVHVGDLIDEHWKSFDPLLAITETSVPPLKFVLGNHDFYVADEYKHKVPMKLGLTERYFTFREKNWLFIVLDGNDLSTYAWQSDSKEHEKSMAAYEAEYAGLPKWNGGIGKSQLRWFEKQLAEATQQGLNTLIFCHFPIFPDNKHNLWNSTDVLTIIDQYPTVKAWVNGHNHDGLYGERNGVHYLTLHGMVDTDTTAYSQMTLTESSIEINGVGREPSRRLVIKRK